MRYRVKVPAGLFEGSSGQLYFKTRDKFRIESGTFSGYAGTTGSEIWSICCDEQALMMLLLRSAAELLPQGSDRVCCGDENVASN